MAVSLHGNNGLVTTNGTAAAPSLAAPDTDTGLYFGTNLIHATTSGTERLQITATGTIKVAGQLSGNSIAQISNHSGGFQIYGSSNNSTHRSIIFCSASNDASEKLRITSTGLVGIGESTPTSLLHLKRSSTTAYSSSATNNDNTIYLINEGAGGHASIQFQTVSGGTANTGQANINVFCEGNSAKNTAIAFGTRGASGDPAERLRIDSTGRVGIGTNNPSVYSNLAYNLVVRTTGNTGMTLRSGSTSSGSILFASADNSTSNEGIFQYKHNDKAFEFNNYGGGAEKFIYKIQGTEKLRIDSAGRLLIGRTSAYAHVDADNLIVGNEATNEHQGITILSHSGKYGGIYFGDGHNPEGHNRCKIIYDHPNDALRIGTAGAAATQLYLNAAGDVGIGVSPSSGIKLHIKDTSSDGAIKLEGTGSTLGTWIALQNNDATANAYSMIQGADAGGQGTSEIKFINVNNSNNEGTLTIGTRPSGGSMQERLRIKSDGKFSFGTDNTGNYGQWQFVNRSSTNGNEVTNGEKGLVLFTSKGFTGANVVSNDTWVLKLVNNAFNGSGVSGNQGTVAKILFNTATSNGWNAYGAIGLDTVGTSGGKGDLFFNTGGTTNGNERVRITSSGLIGIGESSPDGSIHIKDSNPSVYFEDNSGTHGQTIIQQNNDNLKIRCDAGNASSGTGSNISLEVDSFQKMKIHGNYAGTVDVKGIPAHLRLYSQRDTSDWDANDEIGKIEFHVGDDATNNLPYTTNFIKSVNTVDNKNEPDGAIVFGSCRHNQSGGAVETMRLSHSEHYDNVANLQTQGVGAIRDVYNMMNIAPNGSFDNVTDNQDGGATYWNIENGTTIKLHSTSGGHGGNWGRGIALRQAGWYYWRMCVRVTDTCGAIHGSTSTSKYKYPIAFRFHLHATGDGNACQISLWNEFATSGTCNSSQSGTGSLATGTMVTKTGHPVYLPQSTYQPIYHTNGYQGVRLLNIYSLELVQCGAPTTGAEHNGTW